MSVMNRLEMKMVLHEFVVWIAGFSALFFGFLYIFFGALLALSKLIASSINKAIEQPSNIRIWAEFVKYKREKMKEEVRWTAEHDD